MQKIVAINGSPKFSQSSSGAIIHKLADMLKSDLPAYRALDIDDTDLQKLLQADVLLIVFPLYIDCLHAALLDVLTRLEQAAHCCHTPLPRVYAIANCGFYDAEQNATALQIIENFCNRSGLIWQYGIGCCGGMIGGDEKGIKTKGALGAALTELCTAVSSEPAVYSNNIYVRTGAPRFLYHLLGNFSWKMMLRKSAKKANINAKPHIE